MIKKITRTSQFKRDAKLAKKQGNDLKQLEEVLSLIIVLYIKRECLLAKYKDHLLINFDDCRECHIKPDWLLIYKIVEDELILVRMGSHSQLFRK